MSLRLRASLQIATICVIGAIAATIAGCGGNGTGMIPPVKLSVALANPRLSLTQGGTISSVIIIMAPTESVQLQLSNLPTGVTGAYSATPQNPSGILRFAATDTAMIGTSMPIVTVMSSGGSASQVFSLEIAAKPKP